MPPTPALQLALPLLLDEIPPPTRPPAEPSIHPKEVWRTVDRAKRTRLRLTWLQVMEGVSDEQY